MCPKLNIPKRYVPKVSAYLKPSINHEQLLQQGIALHQKGQLSEAHKIYGQILKNDPKHFHALQLTATLYAQQKKYTEALHFFDTALLINPNFAPANNNRGNTLRDLKRFDEALLSYDRAIELKPDYAEAYYNRGNPLKELKRFDEALLSYDRAIELKPDYAEAYNNRGNPLRDLKRFDEALLSYDRAIELKPDYAEAYNNRGNTLRDLKRFDEALLSYDRAIELKPDYAEAYNNRGNTLRDLKRFDEALLSYDRAIELKPDYAEASWNKSLLKLLLGKYEEGWQLYESRKDKEETKDNYPKFPVPLWLGDASIEGKTLLVHSEQGLGDTLQFCRYLTMLKSFKPKEIIFHVEKKLMSLLSSIDHEITLIEKGQSTQVDIHFYCPLMSLPLAFKTTLETIPANIPYLTVNDIKNKYWQDRLGQQTKPRIGLVWSGSTTHKNDLNRSLKLQQLSSLLELPFEFHSLQKDIRDGDKQTLKAYKNLDQHHKDLDDFSDTAALINQMDLIISVDTSVAHLTGALGKKVWVLLPFIQDFRWLLDRDDSPWYPTAKLFRQPQIGDWESVIQQLINELNTLFHK